MQEVEAGNDPSKDSKRYNRNPKCARCRNHGITTNVKGHKRYCPYTKCVCSNCTLVAERRRLMALQIALRRTQIQENHHTRREDSHQRSPTQNRLPPTILVPARNVDAASSYITKQHLEESLQFLMTVLDASHLTPKVCLYTILKECQFNAHAAYRKIIHGQEDINLIFEEGQMEMSMPAAPTTSHQVRVECQECHYPPPLTFLAPYPTRGMKDSFRP